MSLRRGWPSMSQKPAKVAAAVRQRQYISILTGWVAMILHYGQLDPKAFAPLALSARIDPQNLTTAENLSFTIVLQA